MSSTLTPTTLGVNQSSPSYTIHGTGTGFQFGTLLLSGTNSSSTSVRGEIALNDSSRTLTINNNGVGSMMINSTGQINFYHNLLCSVTTATATASTTTTNFVSFSSTGAGVYLLLVSQCSSSASSSINLIDNLTKLVIVICSNDSSQTCQIINLYNPNTIYFALSANGQYGINLTVNSGAFSYRAFFNKIF